MTPDTEASHINVYIQWLERVEERLDVLCTLKPYEDHPVPKAAARVAEAKELLKQHLESLTKEPSNPDLIVKIAATIIRTMRSGTDLLALSDSQIAEFLISIDEDYEDMDVHYLTKAVTHVRNKFRI